MDSRDTERGFSTSALIPQEYEIMEPEEDFDAFNGDTFGNDAETWTKEDHDQLVGAHITEEETMAGSDFFEFGTEENFGDDSLLGGAIEPEGEETAEANGGKVHYLLEGDVHPDDLNEARSQDFAHNEFLESNGHSLGSKFEKELNLKHQPDEALQKDTRESGEGTRSIRQASEVHLNLGQGASHHSQTIPSSNVLQGGESLLQPGTSFGHGSGCPQHPNHFHHHGAHQDMSTLQMSMPNNPIGTQGNTALTQQQPTVIFAAAPPGHQMPMPVIAGFPPAPNMQMHSGVAPPVLSLHPGHQAFPPQLSHGQAIHLHNHAGQSLPPPHLQGQNLHGFPPSIPPPHSSNLNSRAPVPSRQEFNDPAIMSVSKLPPPRPPLQQPGLPANSLPTNIMQMNSKLTEASQQHGPRPIIPVSSNVKSLQELEREMMGGFSGKKVNIGSAQANKIYQPNRPQGPLPHRMGYNNNYGHRQMHMGIRNNQNNQHFYGSGGNNFNQRYVNHQSNFPRMNNSFGGVNSFDDKNRDTFGEDFVMDHQVQQQARQQRYHYGEREHNFRRGGNGLITPGHVHVLGILRGARENQGKCGAPSEPTGNPHLDMKQQHQQERNTTGESFVNNKEDEFSGLMTLRERQWIVNIQLNQLKCENPFLDDYYYTIFNQKRNASEQDTKSDTKIMYDETKEVKNKLNIEEVQADRRQRLEAANSISSDDGVRTDSGTSKPQVKRSEEGAQLLLPAETRVTDGIGTNAVNNSGDNYTPKQFTNSLGCLQAVTVKAPRKIIDVGVIIEGQEQNVNTNTITSTTMQKDTKNFKQTLIELERLYGLLIEVEDCEKKLTALPTGTSMRLQVEKELSDAKNRIRCGPLTDAGKLKKYMLVRKGKALLVRALRLLDDENTKVFCNTLFSLYALATRKDRDDQLLGLLWEGGLARHLNAPGVGNNFEMMYGYLTLICTGSTGSFGSSTAGSRGNSKSPPPESSKPGNTCLSNLKSVLSTPLGVAVMTTCIQGIGLLQQNDEQLMNEECFKLWFSQLAKELGESKEIANTGGIGMHFNEPFILPQFLTSKEKNSFSKLVKAVKPVE